MPVGEEVLYGVVSAVEHLPVPAYALDTAGVVLAWNRALARLTGVSGEEKVGKNGGAHATPFVGSPGYMLADLAIDRDRPAPAHLSAIESDGDDLSARLETALSGVGCALAVRAAPIVVEGMTIGAIEVVLAPTARGPDPTVAGETVARLLQTARHDIKNELTIVLGYIGLARDSLTDPAACVGLDRAAAAAEEIGRLIDLSRELGELGERPSETRNLEAMIRGSAARADLGGIDLEITVSQSTVMADPVVFNAFDHFFERLFAYTVATVPRPSTIRVGASGRDPLLIVYEDDARRVDPCLYPDGGFTHELDRDLVMLRDLLSLDDIGLSATPDPLRLELRIPGFRVRTAEKKE